MGGFESFYLPESMVVDQVFITSTQRRGAVALDFCPKDTPQTLIWKLHGTYVSHGLPETRFWVSSTGPSFRPVNFSLIFALLSTCSQRHKEYLLGARGVTIG